MGIGNIICGLMICYMVNMLLVAIFEMFILDGCFGIELSSFEDMGKRIFVPFYSLFNYPYLIIKAIYKQFKKLKKRLKNKEQDKINKEKVKYTDIIRELHKINENIFIYYVSEDLEKNIHSAINKILEQYKIILSNELFIETAFNRLNCLSAFINECVKNNVLNEEDILNQIKKMCIVTENLLDELVENIEDTENKVKKELKDYLMSKTNEFVDITSSMINDFKEFNKEGLKK